MCLVLADEAIFQFGKCSADEYVLDFKYPLSPIQAFAIALSTYHFTSLPLSQQSGLGASGYHNYHDAQNPGP
jgi:hypothetical protein